MNDAEIEAILNKWVEGMRPKTRQSAGTYAGVAVVLDRLRKKYDLDDETLFTEGGGRVAGQNPDNVKRIVHEFDPGIVLNSIGGRTNPGPALEAKKLIALLRPLSPNSFPVENRDALLERLLRFCVDSLRGLQNRERFEFVYTGHSPLQKAFTKLLASDKDSDQLSAMAQHLVGAKLEIRFPGIGIERASYAANDTNKAGDFTVHDHVFHVSINPDSGHIAKCVKNIDSRKQPVLLVPEEEVKAAYVLTRDNEAARGRVGVKAIEAFVAQNVEELGEFSVATMLEKVRELLNTYNDRIRSVELGKPYLEIEWSGLE